MRLLLTMALVLATAAAYAGNHALVIGNANFANLPPLPGCAASAQLLAARLRQAGWQVRAQADLGNGALSGAVADFEQTIGHEPGLIYICSYGAGFGARDFILPVSASVARPTDLLTQGVLDRSVLPAGAGPLLIALDLARDPGGTLPAVGGGLARGAVPEGVGVAVVLEARPTSAATEFAAALGQAGPGVPAASAVTKGLAAVGVYDAAVPAPAPVAAPAPALPDDAKMTAGDRSKVQAALARLGYYDGKVDGIFGPDSRAAIRRWQHEQKLPMTGTLNSDQASRLVRQ